jgi:hypothetical protein
MDFSIFSSFLPEGLLFHFDIVDFKELGDLETKKDYFYIYLDEKNIPAPQSLMPLRFFFKFLKTVNVSKVSRLFP